MILSQNKNISKIYLILSAIFWIVLVILSSKSAIGTTHNPHIYKTESSVFLFFKNGLLSLFFTFILLYFREKQRKTQIENFTDLIWNGFGSAAFSFIALISIEQLSSFGGENTLIHNRTFINVIYHLNIIFIAIFVGKIFYVFKEMVLYHRSKKLQQTWRIYELLIYLSLVISTLSLGFKNPFQITFLIITIVFSLILSLNMKWVAYLNFKQKWRSILLIFLVLMIAASFMKYIHDHSKFTNHQKIYALNDLLEQSFIIVLFIFITFYSIASILVILFNLPTSSVFEQKIGEILNFQKLSQSIQVIDEEAQIYDILLETSISTVLADAAWLEIIDNKGHFSAFINKNIDKYDIFEIKKICKQNNLIKYQETSYVKDLNKLKRAERIIKETQYRSVLLVPLYTHNKLLGLLGLIKNIPDGFNKDITDIVNSFVSQASVSIENARLLSEAIEHERYKEEIKIARNVQKKLLPTSLRVSPFFEIKAFSEAADDVGGDYYDSFELSEDRTAIVIADVSGHGTTAAFNMAQLKGVFQSLVLMNFSTVDFVKYANKALSNCLERNTFVTLSIFIIDTKNKNITSTRAGHCPTLYYNAEEKCIYQTNKKGLGLGILRNNQFDNHVIEITQNYEPNDVLFLYTDGIIEARNKEKEEYGTKQLEESLKQNGHLNSTLIIQNVINDLYAFCGDQKLEDDYTCLAVKFIK